MTTPLNDTVSEIYRQDSRRVFSTLVRLLGSFDAAEDALHDAFIAASEQWPAQGVPANPVAWLVSAGRFKAIDPLRRDRRFVAGDDAQGLIDSVADEAPGWEQRGDEREAIEDDRLRLVFTCCHPSLAEEARIALTLREVCGLTTEAIARAFLVPAPTLAQRIVRAKTKIRNAGIPYEVPDEDELDDRLEVVLAAIYLVFSEGYSTQATEIADEAIRLGRLLVEFMPRPEVLGLLALMLLHDSRRAARLGPNGDALLIGEQDTALWDRRQIAEGAALVRRSMAGPEIGHYAIQAAIALEHTRRPIDWSEVTRLYRLLVSADPSPVVRLNQAVAIAMHEGPANALPLVEALIGSELVGYHLAHAARADLCRRLGRSGEAREAYEQALRLATSEPDRRFLLRRISELSA